MRSISTHEYQRKCSALIKSWLEALLWCKSATSWIIEHLELGTGLEMVQEVSLRTVPVCAT